MFQSTNQLKHTAKPSTFLSWAACGKCQLPQDRSVQAGDDDSPYSPYHHPPDIRTSM